MADSTWIVVSDAARARIFVTDPELTGWAEHNVLVHPASRSGIGELVSDTHAHSTGRGPRSGPRQTDTHDNESVRFARELAVHLRQQRTAGAYESLVIVAAPRFLGQLRPLLDKNVAAMVQTEIAKDYANLRGPEVHKRVSAALMAATA